MLLILIFGDDRVYTAIALAAAAVHELGHIIAAALLKIRFRSLSIDIFGAKLGLAAPLYSYRREWLLSAAGPATNLVTGGIAYYIYYLADEPENLRYVLFFAIASLFLAVLNLLPIRNFDGGRMLLCIMAPLLSLIRRAAHRRAVFCLCTAALGDVAVPYAQVGSRLRFCVLNRAFCRAVLDSGEFS